MITSCSDMSSSHLYSLQTSLVLQDSVDLLVNDLPNGLVPSLVLTVLLEHVELEPRLCCLSFAVDLLENACRSRDCTEGITPLVTTIRVEFVAEIKERGEPLDI